MTNLHKQHNAKQEECPWLQEPQNLSALIAAGDTELVETLALVLDAVDIAHLLINDQERPNKTLLLTAEEDAELALFHLEQYQQENCNWPPAQPARLPFSQQPQPTAIIMACLIAFSFYIGPWSTANPWFLRGAVDSEAILTTHQWWRLFTALTLHADLLHLAGNCLLGGCIVHLLGQTTGYGLAWLLLALNGAAGNLLNILFRQESHLSVGFSTSIFAAIGLFAGMQILRGGRPTGRNLLLPLGASLALLAFLSTEGERTDLGAHFFGFLSGLICGALVNLNGLLIKMRYSRIQRLFFLLSMGMIVLAWLLAWSERAAPQA